MEAIAVVLAVIGSLGFTFFIVFLAINMIRKKHRKVPLIGLFISFVLIIIGGTLLLDQESRQPSPKIKQKIETSMEAKQSLITFKTLRRWNVPSGGIGMELLVSEKATKKEVMALAQHLRSKYLSKGFINIHIFDLEEAYLHRDDSDYSEKKYFKHYLINLVRNPKTGYNKINWMAKGRDH